MCIFLLLAGLIIHVAAFAQTLPQPEPFHVYQSNENTPTNYLIVDPLGPLEKQDANDTLRLIIRLQANPMPLPGGRHRSNIIQEQHEQFKADLSRLSGNAGNARTSSSPSTVHYEYSNTFNGFAITTSRRVAEQIRKLSYVASVDEDKRVEALYSDNNEVIRAPQAWQDFGVTGKNITIGILDTGIDYNHPDLGQGFGPQYKVSGGYDFVNNDSDPMDDHGHGTHVAGIAAANGSAFKGVAPDAKLIAYKVLNQGGYGFDSWILAAIERCVDPDQNPDTDDALDIVNMSLGREPDPHEPLSEAVNNAVAQGVIFSIAAGNLGDYFTIATPGIAEGAITVGATDNQRHTADFSSKGPGQDFAVKPDVSAPGVHIYSTFLNQQYETFSGTSMASPHVAGAAALILEMRPEWTPEMVKYALIGSARSQSQVVWDQGAGVIDVYASLDARHLAAPGIIHFGTAGSSASLLKTASLTVVNTGKETSRFDVVAEGILTSSPFSLKISPTSLTLDPGESRDIQLTLTSASPIAMQNLPEAYTGSILIRGDVSVACPAVLLNPQKTVVNFTGQLPDMMVVAGVEPTRYGRRFQPQGDQRMLELNLPKGKYDLVSYYNNCVHTVMREDVSTDQNVELTMDKSMAKNLVVFRPVDHHGNLIDGSKSADAGAFFSGPDRNIVTVYPGYVDSLYVSDTDQYKYEFKYTGKSAAGNAFYDIAAGTESGIRESKLCSNDPAAFSKITIHNPSIPDGTPQRLSLHYRAGAGHARFVSDAFPVEMPANFTLMQTQNNSSSTFFGSFIKFLPLPEQPGYTWETADIRAEEGNTISFKFWDQDIVTLAQQDLDYRLGSSIPSFNLVSDIQSAKLRFSTFLGPGAVNHGLGEREGGNVYYKIYNSESVIKEGSFEQSIFKVSESVLPEVEVTPGIYQFDFEYRDFQTGGKFGLARFSGFFDTRAVDPNPPYLKSLRLLVNGRDTNEIVEEQTAIIQFTVGDCNDCPNSTLKTTSLSIKHPEDRAWTVLPTQSHGNDQFSVQLPSSLSAGYYSLQWMSEDLEGNRSVYDLAPAFLVGERVQSEPYITVNLISPANYSMNAGTRPVFRWSAIEGSSYMIQVADNPDFAGSVIEALTTTATYNLPGPLKKNTTYYWRVRVAHDNNAPRWSPVFQFDASFLPTAQLLRPEHQSVIPYSVVDFTWSPVPNAYQYKLEVSESENFASYIHVAYTLETTSSITNLRANTKYHWRIKSFFYHQGLDEESVSTAFEFKTEALPAEPLPPPVLLNPPHESRNQPLSMLFEWSSDPLASSYYFELSTKDDFSTIHASGDLETSSIRVSLNPSTDYYWRVTPRLSDIPQRASLVSTFQSVSLSPPTLLFPTDNAVDMARELEVKWSKVANSEHYVLELSESKDFDPLFLQETLEDTVFMVTGLQSGTYHWRVLSHIVADGDIAYDTPSKVFTFRTAIEGEPEPQPEPGPVTSVHESVEERVAYCFPNPFRQGTDIIIVSETNDRAEVRIVDPLGRKIRYFSWALQQGKNGIYWDGYGDDKKSLDAGIYFAMIVRQNRPPFVIRLVKTR